MTFILFLRFSEFSAFEASKKDELRRQMIIIRLPTPSWKSCCISWSLHTIGSIMSDSVAASGVWDG